MSEFIRIQFFFTHFLALVAGWSCFCLRLDLAVHLTISLGIGRVELINSEDIIGFLGWFL